MKPIPWKCSQCLERAVVPTVLPTYELELEHDGRNYSLVLKDFQVFQCSSCKNIVFDDKANEQLTEALRAEIGLLQPSEIRRGREALKLTQNQLAQYLSISDSTLARWENGAQIQQRSMDRFIRVFFELEELRRFLAEPHSETEKAASGMSWTTQATT